MAIRSGNVLAGRETLQGNQGGQSFSVVAGPTLPATLVTIPVGGGHVGAEISIRYDTHHSASMSSDGRGSVRGHAKALLLSQEMVQGVSVGGGEVPLTMQNLSAHTTRSVPLSSTAVFDPPLPRGINMPPQLHRSMYGMPYDMDSSHTDAEQ